MVDGAFGGQATCGPHSRLVESMSDKRPFDGTSPPRPRGDAAERDPNVADRATVRLEFQADSGACRRELVRLAVAHLEVVRAAQRCGGRNLDRDDQLTERERVLNIGRVAGQQEEVIDRDATLWLAIFNVDGSVEGDKSHCTVNGISGGAAWTPAQDSMAAVDALKGCAARTGIAFVAGAVDPWFAEIAAACPLHEIATDGGHVAQLGRGAAPQRFRQNGELLPDPGGIGDIAHF